MSMSRSTFDSDFNTDDALKGQWACGPRVAIEIIQCRMRSSGAVLNGSGRGRSVGRSLGPIRDPHQRFCQTEDS